MCWTAFGITCKTGDETYVAPTDQSSRHHGCNQRLLVTSHDGASMMTSVQLVGYIAATFDYAHVMRIKDPPA